jgi:hypothetical protein
MIGLWRGRSPGRPRGTPNKSSQRVKAFLDEVFGEALARQELKKRLIEEIVTLKIDTKLLALLLAYYAGRPAVAVDHTGTVSLAKLIAGDLDGTEDEDDPGA